MRVQLLLTKSEVAVIDAFVKETKMRSRNEAIRALLEAALEAWRAEKGKPKK